MLVRVRDAVEEGKLVWTINFQYDEKLKDYLKEIVPSQWRRWNPEKKVWVVTGDPFTEQPVTDFLNYAKKLGYKVSDTRKFDYAAQEAKKEKARQQQEQETYEQARRAREQWERLQEEARKAREKARSSSSPPRSYSYGNWADNLLQAVGPEREKAVYRALLRILHPDLPDTGSHELTQELTIAWEKRNKK